MSLPAPALEELCSCYKSGCRVGLSVLLQVGCDQGTEGDGAQQSSLVPTLLFVLKPCSVTLHTLHPPGRNTKPDILKIGFVWSVVWGFFCLSICCKTNPTLANSHIKPFRIGMKQGKWKSYTLF